MESWKSMASMRNLPFFLNGVLHRLPKKNTIHSSMCKVTALISMQQFKSCNTLYATNAQSMNNYIITGHILNIKRVKHPLTLSASKVCNLFTS